MPRSYPRFRSKKNQVLKKIRTELPEVIEKFAYGRLLVANTIIERNRYQRGVALGPGSKERDLIASGYVATAKENGYEAAVARVSGMNSRDARRGLWADKAEVEGDGSEVRVKVAYALGRAALMHDGYVHARSGQYMAGTPFLEEAFSGEAMDDYVEVVGDFLKTLEQVRFLTEEEMKAEWAADLARSSRAAGKREQREMFKEFMAAQGNVVAGIRANKGGQVIGAREIKSGPRRGHMIPIRRKMDRDEIRGAIEDAFHEWLSGRSNPSMGAGG